MAEAFIVRRGGGGGSGGTLVVTSSGAGTVTVSNSTLGKSYSKSVAVGGSVTFKGLKTGEWTVTLSNGTQTATRSVTINADYSVSVAYFSATISVTYPATSTCVITNSDGQTVASDTNNSSSTKTWTATVGATGTYTVTATATDGSGKTKSTTVSITADGQSKSATLTYELVLFNNGTYAAETGGWSGISGNVLQSSTRCNNMNGEYQWTCQTNKPVDLTGYSNLHVRVASLSKSYYFTCEFGVGASRTSHKAKFDIEASTTYSLPIGSYNEALYLSLHHGGAAQENGGVNGNTTIQISKVWLT